VIARGTTKHPLNITWTLEGLAVKPKMIAIQYALKSNRQVWTNITVVPNDVEKFDFYPPKNMPPSTEYLLRMWDVTNGEQPHQEGGLYPAPMSTMFVVYQPASLDLEAQMPPVPGVAWSAAPATSLLCMALGMSVVRYLL
jgi:hypothetical protein